MRLKTAFVSDNRLAMMITKIGMSRAAIPSRKSAIIAIVKDRVGIDSIIADEISTVDSCGQFRIRRMARCYLPS